MLWRLSNLSFTSRKMQDPGTEIQMTHQCPGNLYGDQNLTSIEWLGSCEFERLIDNVPASSGLHGRTSASPCDSSTMAKIIQEGGAGLINFLLSAAVKDSSTSLPSHQWTEKIPKVSKVREWQYRDLTHLPKAVQEEWKTACKEELEALCQHNVFELTDLPKGCKTIGCGWVFNIKSDRQKKARLVAQGFSQVEGINLMSYSLP